MTPRIITEFLQNKPFFYQIINYPKIFGLCFDILIKCLEGSPDWRVLRLVKYTVMYIVECKHRNGFIPLDITYVCIITKLNIGNLAFKIHKFIY